ncbi:MAG: type II secretion system protein [Verrucomicrobiota bacterium]
MNPREFHFNRRWPVRTGFSLVELLVVMAVIGVLAGLLLPVLTRGKLLARRTACASNLHQLSIAASLYWEDNCGRCFRVSDGPANNGTLWWFGWLDNTRPEGQRAFDLSTGRLYPYLRGSDVRLCPSLDPAAAPFKLKASGVVYSYGYNSFLSAAQPVLANALPRPAETALFADAVQVNDFQAPASRSRPMLEEWYFLDNPTNTGTAGYYPHGHFRHAGQAGVAFCDGHVGQEKMLPGSEDSKMPAQRVGRFRPEILASH